MEKVNPEESQAGETTEDKPVVKLNRHERRKRAAILRKERRELLRKKKLDEERKAKNANKVDLHEQ